MATQNSTITVKGKLGNIVGYKGRDGKRLARIRQTEVKNPKTKGQIIQRMILATASKAYGRMKSIVDHSWQGVSYGGVSQSYFLKKAMERIRKFVADSFAAMPGSITDPHKWVGLARPNSLGETGFGLQISEGTIPSVPAVYAEVGEGEDKDTVLDHFGNTITVTAGGIAKIQQVLNSIGAKIGDQITAVGLNLAKAELSLTRYVINANATSEELNEDWDGSVEMAGLDYEKSVENGAAISAAAEKGSTVVKLMVNPSNGGSFDASAIIISRKVNGVWQRSTQYLMPKGAVDNVDAIIKLWELGSTEIPTENPYYLNNADL